MAGATDKELALAKVYSKSMLDLAESQGQADELLDELHELADMIDKNAALGAFLSSPTVDVTARAQTLEKAFRGKASDLLVDSLQVLNRKERLGLLRAVCDTYRLAHEESRNIVDVHITTAVPLSDTLRGKIREAAAKFAGMGVELVERVDESVIGGLTMRIGDEKLDTTVAMQLRQISEAMQQRASQEVHGGKAYVEFG
ncbi:MAG: ATP synthase F1 subunit delta [Planctomycetes bacterium]|nr:ATP synthase F1 subunit delta [Planctomycetota bacterium]